MFDLFEKTSADCSRITTKRYSTSFSLGIRLISKEYRWAIYAIYGMVRFADEIVDTFDREDRAELLEKFRLDTYEAMQKGISLNPILHSFQKAARSFNIGEELVQPFFDSMAMDLNKTSYSENTYSEYIYGSAEVVGLMCLKVFCHGNEEQYEALKAPARSLGAAFQKVNFLRDMKSDLEERGRVYFPGINFSLFNEHAKQQIILDVKDDFGKAYKGIVKLPVSCRFGVYIAYTYYLKLLEKLERTNARRLMESRIRIDNGQKMMLLATSYFKFKTNVL